MFLYNFRLDKSSNERQNKFFSQEVALLETILEMILILA